MGDIDRGTNFIDSGSYRAADLNNLVDNATVKTSLITGKSSVTPASGDTILISDLSNSDALSKVTVSALSDYAQLSSNRYAVDSGSANAYAITLSPAATAYATGMVVQFKATNTNTAASTINVNALGAKDIQYNTAALAGGEIVANGFYSLIYDGTQFQFLNKLEPGQLPAQTTVDAASDGITFYDASAKLNSKATPASVFKSLTGLTAVTGAGADQVVIADASDSNNAKKVLLAGITVGVPYVKLIGFKASGSDGGDFTSGDWRTRELNSESADTGGICTLSSNQFTLAAGTYYMQASAPAFKVNGHLVRLYNVTDAATIEIGTAEVTAAGNDVQTRSYLNVRFDIGASKALELQHICETTRNSDGLGNGASFGTNNIFASVELWQLAAA